MSREAMGYDASRIEVLDGREAVRKRPGMFVGSTGERGVRHMLFTVVDRAVNDVLAAGTGSVEVTLTPDGVRVVDGGPGIPVEAAGHCGGPTLEALLSRWATEECLSGRHIVDAAPFFNSRLFVVNALSSRLTAEVRRDGERWVQEYARGVAVSPPVAVGPASDTGTGTATGTGTGTAFFFHPDGEIFETPECSYDAVEQRLRELALLYTGLEISLTDERAPGESRSCRFRFPGGTRDFVPLLEGRAGNPVHADVIHFEREEPRMAGVVEVALRWSDGDGERMRSFANSRATNEGGTHTAGFRAGLAAALTAYGRMRGLLTADDPDFGPERIGRGLTSVVSVRLDHPEFEGSTRGRLAGDAVRVCVEKAVREHLSAWLDRHPEQAAAVITAERTIGASPIAHE